jgi:hypothetical protein
MAETLDCSKCLYYSICNVSCHLSKFCSNCCQPCAVLFLYSSLWNVKGEVLWEYTVNGLVGQKNKRQLWDLYYRRMIYELDISWGTLSCLPFLGGLRAGFWPRNLLILRLNGSNFEGKDELKALSLSSCQFCLQLWPVLNFFMFVSCLQKSSINHNIFSHFHQLRWRVSPLFNLVMKTLESL